MSWSWWCISALCQVCFVFCFRNVVAKVAIAQRLFERLAYLYHNINPLKPNDPYRGPTAPLTSKHCITTCFSCSPPQPDVNVNFSSTVSSTCICVQNHCHRAKAQLQLNKYYYYYYYLYIYSTNIGIEYFKHGIYFPFFSLQNSVCFIILTYLVPVLFTFYIQGVL